MSKTLWVTPDVYEHILNNPNSIIVEAQGKAPMELKVIGFPYDYNPKRKNNVNNRIETENDRWLI